MYVWIGKGVYMSKESVVLWTGRGMCVEGGCSSVEGRYFSVEGRRGKTGKAGGTAAATTSRDTSLSPSL